MTQQPYLAAQTNKATGDPQLLGTTGATEPIYNEGPLKALPVSDNEDDEDGDITVYNFGEDAYLDPSFLQAMGSLSD